MGLYPRYAKLVEQGAGAWFAARTRDGRLVGLASARPDGEAVLGRWMVLSTVATQGLGPM